MRRLRLDDLELAYEEAGDGPAVVFVHGLGGSVYSWSAQLAAVSGAGYRAIAYDQRGAGLSSKPEGPYSVELWVADLQRVLDELGLERAALVGHSVGCMVAERAAVALGERCSALAVIGGAVRWRPQAGPVFEERVALARSGRMDKIAAAVAVTGLSERCRTEDPALHGLFLSLIASNDPAAYAEWSAATAKATMSDLEELRCPVLALAGEHDPVTPPESAAAAIAAAVSDGRSRAIAGAAHWCQIEAPDAVNEALLGFLAE